MAKKTPIFGPTCLVTGGSGFLGRALSKALLDRGCVVHSLDIRPDSNPHPRIRYFSGDIRDFDAVRAAIDNCSTVFHCAAVMNFLGVCRPSVRREVYGINVKGTENVVRACREAGAKSLVYTSSHVVCFDTGPVIAGDESKPYARRYLDLYGKTKTAAERIVLAANGNGLRTAALRPGGIWGSSDDCYMFAKFIDQLLKGKLVATIGPADAIIDNTHVDNLVLAEVLAAEALVKKPEVVGGQAYFIVDDEPMNLMEWLRPLIEGLGYRLPKRSIPKLPMYFLGFLAECLHFIGGPRPFMTRLEVHNLTAKFTFRQDKARRDLGFEPIINSEKGMKECVEFYRKYVNN
ncbi:MAG: NAD-dependent epimerase/dehydratase family protein [Spirochaetes bacterium]|nr:NAD-dependent epimerase/dehydratase family protein [Spirochaetota bacterium]